MVIPMFEIEQDIIDQVKGNCHSMGICLFGDLTLCGKVKDVSQDYLVVDPHSDHQCADCPYGFKFKDKEASEDVFACVCPVRKEIFRKYGK
jgi:hypothetical protein